MQMHARAQQLLQKLCCVTFHSLAINKTIVAVWLTVWLQQHEQLQ